MSKTDNHDKRKRALMVTVPYSLMGALGMAHLLLAAPPSGGSALPLSAIALLTVSGVFLTLLD